MCLCVELQWIKPKSKMFIWRMRRCLWSRKKRWVKKWAKKEEEWKKLFFFVSPRIQFNRWINCRVILLYIEYFYSSHSYFSGTFWFSCPLWCCLSIEQEIGKDILCAQMFEEISWIHFDPFSFLFFVFFLFWYPVDFLGGNMGGDWCFCFLL